VEKKSGLKNYGTLNLKLFNYKFNSEDIHFTIKDGILYAFCMGTSTE
jgi:hypothetical protein